MMEGKGLCGNRAPGLIIRLVCQVRTGEAVGTNGHACFCLEIGEEPTDKGVGNPIGKLPAGGCFGSLGAKGMLFLIRDQSGQVGKACAHTQIHALVEIHFNVHVAGIARYGAEEKFQTAILVRCAQLFGLYRTNLLIIGSKVDQNRLVVISDLRPGLHILRGL